MDMYSNAEALKEHLLSKWPYPVAVDLFFNTFLVEEEFEVFLESFEYEHLYSIENDDDDELNMYFGKELAGLRDGVPEQYGYVEFEDKANSKIDQVPIMEVDKMLEEAIPFYLNIFTDEEEKQGMQKRINKTFETIHNVLKNAEKDHLEWKKENN